MPSNMDSLVLGKTTCDVCEKPIIKGQQIVSIGLSKVTKSGQEVVTPEPEIRYACHLKCWEGVEVDY